MSRLVVVDRKAMPVRAWDSLLSGREKAEVSTYTAKRRDRSVTSRVLVKYLMAKADGPAYRELHADHIAAVSHEELAAVETLSGSARQRTGAAVYRSGQLLPDHAVSASHCGQFSAAGQGGGRLGIDLERIEERRPEFYRQMFSDQDRQWVWQLHQSEGVSTEAAFTLLWCAKEAYLKASGWPRLSVWNFAHWSVIVGSEVATILRPESPDGSVIAQGRIESIQDEQSFDIGARRLGDMLLVTVQYELKPL